MILERLKRWLGLSKPEWTLEDYERAWNEPELQAAIDEEYYMSGPLVCPPHMKKLGLSCHTGGFQTGVGYFATKLTRSPAATAILELFKDALNERGIPIEFNKIKHGRGKGGYDPDPFALVMPCGNHEIKIATRIDNDGDDRQFCGFVPEETSGGFGIMIYVQRKDSQDYFFKEISCASHYADPSFDPEGAVDDIQQLVEDLKRI